ncbi:Caffeyl-CoA reductase-Etf complex subunit CarE [Candidatus Desulfarcum epimagneticum]|uniref:Caffeyl-CoA reductase-Etf complex subunit CarE n=1 Tax=uncultured Desulfobacteraceae bacterium TaxID=218296 RepID=A0A484HG13_9BACT|nr:Caffeyl-CoA reductase-Etf complex subunit CarE [uncultured Desulfobacteraceae bacterium]
MTVWIEAELCDGCRKCVKQCQYEAIGLEDGKPVVLERCTGCGACLSVCKKAAILTDAKPRAVPDFSDRKGVWVFAEQKNGRLSRVSLELLGEARRLAAALGQEVFALLLGHGVAPLADELGEWGADHVCVAEHPVLEHYRTLPYADVIEKIVLEQKPDILLMGATRLGRDLAPRVSRRVGSGLTADCTELAIDPEEGVLIQTRPAFGGNVMAAIVNRYSRPQMATVRPGIMEAVASPGKKPRIIRHEPDLSEKDVPTRILKTVQEKKTGVDLVKAGRVVAGGRGMGGAEGFKLLYELAGLMDAEVAGTRVAVEEGWIPAENQVGQTGQSTRPELYIACGISGAIQHRAGMLNSGHIVAVNRDPNAAIFSVADWGIVGDVRKIVPEMIKQLKNRA